MIRITGMKVEYRDAPLGLDEPAPRFSCRIDGAGELPPRCRIRVAEGTGRPLWEHTGEPGPAAYAGPPLAPFTRYSWQVTLLDRSGKSVGEAGSFFETGFMGSPLPGMRVGIGPRGPGVIPALKGRFRARELDGVRLALAADGFSQVKINGESSPGLFFSASPAFYQIRDIAPLLKEGMNEIEIFWTPSASAPAGVWAALLRQGRPLAYTGEDWELRLLPEGALWAEGEKAPLRTFAPPAFRGDPGPGIAAAGRLKPTSLRRLPGGEVLADFGELFTGRLLLRDLPPGPGAEIAVRVGPTPEAAGAAGIFRCRLPEKGGDELPISGVAPRFFRCAVLAGLPEKAELEAELFSGCGEQTGRFSCSDHLLTRLYDTFCRLRTNVAVDVFPGQATALSLCAAGAAYTHFSGGSCLRRAVLPGMDGGLAALDELFRHCGDVRTVRALLPGAAAFLEGLGKDDELLPLPGLEDSFHQNDPTPPELLGTAFRAGLHRLCARLARMTEQETLAAGQQEHYERLKALFIRTFYTPELRFRESSQTAKVLALHFDLTPDDCRDLWALVVDDLLRDVEKKRRMHFSTGLLGTALMLPVLTRAEALDTAWQLLRQSSPPSWLFPLIRGVPPAPPGAVPDAAVCCAFGAVTLWFHEEICGIHAEEGFRRFRLAPRFGRFLDHAEASYDTFLGTVVSAWRREGDDYIHSFTVPPGTEALVRGKLYGPGTYSLKIRHY